MDLCSCNFLKTPVEILLTFLFLRLRPRCVGCISGVVGELEVCRLEMANAAMMVLSKGWFDWIFGGERWLPILQFFDGATTRYLQDHDPRCVKYFFSRRPTYRMKRCLLARIQEQREKGARFPEKNMPKHIEEGEEQHNKDTVHEVLWNGKDGFEVKLLTGRIRQYRVSLDNWTCSCGYFHLAGLPCSHAVAAIYKCGKKVEDFIAPCY
ncbi:hypothetical protein D1007_32114 [Hordeum vulgare]|nr:hypothetical protein D1007_32114 [Hordeum vulgare]